MKKLNRRDFMTISAAAAGAVMTTGIPDLALAAGPPKNLIIVLAFGGWDSTYSVDPKPGLTTIDAPAGTIKNFGNLPIFVDPTRPNVDGFFTAYGDLSTLVHGINVRSVAHEGCLKRSLTGTASETNPDLAAITAHELGAQLPVPYLVLGSQAFTGPLAASAGRLGFSNQLTTLADPNQGLLTPNSSDEAAIKAYVQARSKREEAVRGSTGFNKARIDEFNASLTRAESLKSQASVLGGNQFPTFPRQLQTAVDVISRGISHTVMTDTYMAWDTHADNAPQNQMHNDLFGSLKALADDLVATPGSASGSTLLDETVVAVVSEMTRTPLLNGTMGKDHWPYASWLLFGGGIAANKLIGATDNNYIGRPVDLTTGAVKTGGTYLQAENVVAGILEAVGVDASKYFSGASPLKLT